MWALFNPIYVFAITTRQTVSLKGHYSRATKDILSISGIFAIFALFTAGSLFYSNSSYSLFYIFYVYGL